MDVQRNLSGTFQNTISRVCVHEPLKMRQTFGRHICLSKRIDQQTHDYEYQQCQPHGHDSSYISLALQTTYNETGNVRINVTLKRFRVINLAVKKAMSITCSECVFVALGI